jgi:MFS transporter, FSR family, fosmidomycin resistance protein
LAFGIREASWPLVHLELSLSYLQIGLLLSIPGIFSTIVEPSLALLSDTGHRRRVVLSGGVAFALSLLLIASAPGFAVLLMASCLLSRASGAFVSLAQATWMDLQPNSAERNMGRWVLAGSLGAVIGPLALGAAVAMGSSWRGATLAAAILTVPALLAASRIRFPPPHPEIEDLRAALRGALEALREPRVRRWLTLLQLTSSATPSSSRPRRYRRRDRRPGRPDRIAPSPRDRRRGRTFSDRGSRCGSCSPRRSLCSPCSRRAILETADQTACQASTTG